ncbi:hypothetical protein C8R43DRAFT_588237 [Mycena crocata]|nr:hypothetical protein C8R43DRAFT_588237 [Mycena crocata]
MRLAASCASAVSFGCLVSLLPALTGPPITCERAIMSRTAGSRCKTMEQGGATRWLTRTSAVMLVGFVGGFLSVDLLLRPERGSSKPCAALKTVLLCHPSRLS